MIYLFLKQLLILLIFPLLLFVNKRANGKLIKMINLMAKNGGPFFIKSLQWSTQNVNLAQLLCINSIKDIQDYCYTGDIKYAEYVIKKYDLDVEILNYIGSGSIANVYKCKYNNGIYAIKILHKNIKEIMIINKIWAIILLNIIKFTKIIPFSSFDINLLIKDHLDQTDLLKEKNNCCYFYEHKNLFDGLRNVHFPNILYSQHDILIEDFIDGYKYNEFIKKYPSLAKTAKQLHLKSFIYMLFCYNILYADNHDGNIIYNINNNQVNMYFVDCGLVYEIDEKKRQSFCEFIEGYNTKNLNLLTHKMVFCDEIKRGETEKAIVKINNKYKTKITRYVKEYIDIVINNNINIHYYQMVFLVNFLLITNGDDRLLFETIKHIYSCKEDDQLTKILKKYKF